MCINHNLILRMVEQAKASSGVGGNGYRLSACIVDKKGNQLGNIKTNVRKTHPTLIRYGPYPFMHAECNAILGIGYDNCRGNDLVVIRITRTRTPQLSMSRPCGMCERLAKDVGIRRIHYSNWEGKIESLHP